MFDISDITPAAVKVCFHPATPSRNIERNWPFVRDALIEFGLTDKPMVCMALATIRAESEGFEPISERKSLYNTAPGGEPFGLYDGRRDLGNVAAGDGATFRGRGFIQLTGRLNYVVYGQRLNVDLLRAPERANDQDVAARVLAIFLAERQKPIRLALRAGDLPQARKLVNGGRHGLERFADTYAKATAMWPN